MPRYFFHIRWGQASIFDRQGIELANIDEAVKEAVRRGRDIAALDIRKDVAASGGVIIIDDELRDVAGIVVQVDEQNVVGSETNLRLAARPHSMPNGRDALPANRH
jgi:Domain of unknown function (DUF6894)